MAAFILADVLAQDGEINPIVVNLDHVQFVDHHKPGSVTLFLVGGGTLNVYVGEEVAGASSVTDFWLRLPQSMTEEL